MRISEQLLAHVAGNAFSERLKADIDQPAPPRHRFEVIESLVRGTNVVHVGCVDHLALVAEKIRTGTWFHGRLSQVANRCIGIDINREGVAELRSEYDVQNVFYGDVAADRNIGAIRDGTWDYLILGEVLEHVDNPVGFLAAVAANYADRVDRIIVTVPNAFRAGNVRAIFRNQEWINSDHRYWFTPFTLLKVLARAGLAVEALELCHFSPASSLTRALKNVVLRRFPLLCEDLVATCSPSGSPFHNVRHTDEANQLTVQGASR
jgi:hypothetical protein